MVLISANSIIVVHTVVRRRTSSSSSGIAVSMIPSKVILRLPARGPPEAKNLDIICVNNVKIYSKRASLHAPFNLSY